MALADQDRWLSGRRQQTVNLPVNSRGGSNPSLPKVYCCYAWFCLVYDADVREGGLLLYYDFTVCRVS